MILSFYFYYANTLFIQWNFKKAWQLIIEASSIDPDNIDLQLLYLEIYESLKLDTIPIIKQMLKIDPENGVAHCRIWENFIKEKNYEEAMKFFEIALKNDSNDEKAWILKNLVDCCHNLQDYTNWNVYALQIVAKDPNDVHALVMIWL